MKSIRSDLPRLKLVFFCTLVFSLAAHAYMYFSLAPTHDGLNTMIAGGWYSYSQFGLGRFMEPVYTALRGVYAVPWLVGMLSILFLGAATYLLVSVIGIQNRISIALLCGLFSTNMTTIATNATFIYCIDTYMLSLLLACAGVWAWERLPRAGVWAAVPLFVMSMGLYQSYISVAIGAALILLIRDVMQGRRLAALWRQALRYAVSLLAGAGAYYVVLKLTLAYTQAPITHGYNGLGNLFASDLVSVLKLIPMAYYKFAGFFIGYRSYNTLFSRLCVVLLFLCGLFFWLRALRSKKPRGPELAFLVLAVCLLPLGLNFSCVLCAGLSHELMIFPFMLVYVLLLLPLEWDVLPSGGGRAPRLCRGAVFALCAVTVLRCIVVANGAYYYKQIIDKASYPYVFSIVQDIESTDGYEPGVTPVAVLGSVNHSFIQRQTDDFPLYEHVFGMGYTTDVTYSTTFEQYCRFILGHPVNQIQDNGQLSALAQSEAVQAMPVFPHEGYCRMVDGVMVIRLE